MKCLILDEKILSFVSKARCSIRYPNMLLYYPHSLAILNMAWLLQQLRSMESYERSSEEERFQHDVEN